MMHPDGASSNRDANPYGGLYGNDNDYNFAAADEQSPFDAPHHGTEDPFNHNNDQQQQHYQHQQQQPKLNRTETNNDYPLANGDDHYYNQHGDDDYYNNNPKDDRAAANDPYYSTSNNDVADYDADHDGAYYDPNDPYYNYNHDGHEQDSNHVDSNGQQQSPPYYDHTTGAYSDAPNAPQSISDPYLKNNGKPYSDDPNATRDMEVDENGDPTHPPQTTDEKQKKSAKSRLKKYCAGCYTPTCDYRGPCKFPHGCCYSVMGILSAAGGLMTNCYVLGGCIFQRIHPINPVTGDPIPGQERGYGFLSREADYGVAPDYGRCTWYTDAEYDAIFDGWMKTGRFFAFCSGILACACFLILLCTCCCAFSPSMFERWLFWMYIAAAITVALSMFIFGSEYCSENKCTVADGCGHAITAFMFHLISANTVKSFSPPSAPPSSRNNDDGDDVDEELDDLYYEDEDDKYPPFHPDGPRGVTVMEDGSRVYDDGEDYYDDMGRMIDPHDNKGAYQQTKQADMDEDDDESLKSADLDDISDGDLSDYASDKEDDDTTEKEKLKKKQAEYDEFGNPIFDPDAAEEHGNLGVGYENMDKEPKYDEFGNPIPLQQNRQQYDEYGNPILQNPEMESHPQYDEFGNPIHPQSQQAYNEYGQPYDTTQHQKQYDEFGNPLPATDTQRQSFSPEAPRDTSGYRQRDPPDNDDDGGPAFA